MDWSKLTSYRADVKDYALLAHAVPVRRLRRILPERLHVESFHVKDGEPLGFISVACMKNKHFRPSLSSFPRLNFWQISYRCYVYTKGVPCAFTLGEVVQTWPAYATQRLGASDVVRGEIDVSVNRDPSGGYDIYECIADSEFGKLDFYLSAKARPKARHPFDNGADKLKFFHEGRHLVFRSSAAGILGEQALTLSKFDAREGDLKSFQCDYWVKLGLLRADEAFERFHCALVSPSLECVYHPALPEFLMPPAA